MIRCRSLVTEVVAGLLDVGEDLVMGLLTDNIFLFQLPLGLEGEITNESVDLGTSFLLLGLELADLFLALTHFLLDDFAQLFLLLPARLRVVEHLVHEAGHVVLESIGYLLHQFTPLPLLPLDFSPEGFEFFLHSLNQLVFFLLARNNLPLDLGIKLL